MNDKTQFDLPALFQAVGDALRQNQPALNQADTYNGNHGDHMVEIFEVATRAAQEKRGVDLADAMLYASRLLQHIDQNGSAQVYAHGLALLAEQFRDRQIKLDELVAYAQHMLEENGTPAAAGGQASSSRGGEVLKALITALAAWGQIESGQAQTSRPLDMGALFEFGMAYLQAKQRGGSRAEVLADAAASVSPLGKTAHRHQSGKLAIQALLQAMQKMA